MLKFTAVLIGAIVRVAGAGAPGTRLEVGQLVQVTELTRSSIHVVSESGEDAACFTGNDGGTTRLEATEHEAFPVTAATPAPEPAVEEPAPAPGAEGSGGTTEPALSEAPVVSEEEQRLQSEAEVTPPQPEATSAEAGGVAEESVVPPAAVAPA